VYTDRGDPASAECGGGATSICHARAVALFRRKQPHAPSVEHAVILHYKLSGDGVGTEAEREAVYALEDRLIGVIAESRSGEFDGNEFGGGEAVLYIYGPDKDRLWAAVEPVAKNFPLRPAFALVRVGGPEVTGERLHF
jgi:hypothetical protein